MGSFLSPLAAQLKHPDKQKHKDVLTNNSNTTITGLPFSMVSNAWESTSTPSMTFADSSGGYHAFPLTGRQDSNGNVTMVNRSGITLESNDPVNFSMVYSTN